MANKLLAISFSAIFLYVIIVLSKDVCIKIIIIVVNCSSCSHQCHRRKYNSRRNKKNIFSVIIYLVMIFQLIVVALVCCLLFCHHYYYQLQIQRYPFIPKSLSHCLSFLSSLYIHHRQARRMKKGENDKLTRTLNKKLVIVVLHCFYKNQ